MLSIPEVAYSNAVLKCCEVNAIYISPLKLQKLIYLSYATRLKNDKGMVIELVFEAWKYGPVISKIYYSYQHFGSNIVRTYLSYSKDGMQYSLPPEKQSDVEEAIALYGPLHGYQLIDKVHEKNGAWWKAYGRKGDNNVIGHEDIKKEFSNG